MSIVSLPTTLNSLRAAGDNPRQQLQAASEQFEALFLQQILRQMRKAGDVLAAGNPMRSRELDTMRDFYDEVLAETLAQKKQTGIADLLTQQLGGALPASGEQLAAAETAARGAELQRSAFSAPAALAGTWQRGVAAISQAWQRGGAAFGNLVDSVIRHESAGDIAAVSPKGARGLMQLMPGTAREMAAKLGIDFSETRLTSDGEYNKRLGSAYLGEMLERYDGHQALAVAAYNAGPGRVDQWLKELGDPRSGQVGTEAWVQRIPFEETRNYTRSILQDLRRATQASGEPAPAGDALRADGYRAGEVLSMVQGKRLVPDQATDGPASAPERFNRLPDLVAYQQNKSHDPQAGRHQSLSAAFAQSIRIEPKGKLS